MNTFGDNTLLLLRHSLTFHLKFLFNSFTFYLSLNIYFLTWLAWEGTTNIYKYEILETEAKRASLD